MSAIKYRPWLILSLVFITIYAACAVEFFVRFWTDKPVRGGHKTGEGRLAGMNMRMKIIIMIHDHWPHFQHHLFIHSVSQSAYRIIELANGWTGIIISTQLYFSAPRHRYGCVRLSWYSPDVLDGAMIMLAIYTLNFIHPGIFLYGGSSTNIVKGNEKLSIASTTTLDGDLSVYEI